MKGYELFLLLLAIGGARAGHHTQFSPLELLTRQLQRKPYTISILDQQT